MFGARSLTSAVWKGGTNFTLLQVKSALQDAHRFSAADIY